ncbi:MAG: glycosyltransferase [Lachnospirales bacterium]
MHIISGGDSGGAKTHVLTLLSELNKSIDITLLCVMESIFTEEAVELGINTKVISQKNRFDIGSIKKIKSFILKEDFDIVHCHGARANYIATILKLMGLKKPYITTVHSDYLLDFSDQLYKKVVFTNINKFALKRFQYFFAVTKSHKKMLEDRGFKNKKIYTIYNGIDAKEELEYQHKVDFLKEHNVPNKEDYVYVGLCGRLDYVKGIDIFINTCKLLEKEKIIFLIAGTGDEKDKYFAMKKELNIDNLYFLGFVKDVNSFYNAIDINTLASLSESFPYALLEGGLMKKATIASKVGGVPEMIEDNKDGFLFKSGDSEDFAKKIMVLVNDESKRNELAMNFNQKVVNEFSKEKMRNTHLEIYEEIIKEWR